MLDSQAINYLYKYSKKQSIKWLRGGGSRPETFEKTILSYELGAVAMYRNLGE